MQRRRPEHEEAWLVTYADLFTNLLLFFVVLLSAANISQTKMQQIAASVSGQEMPESLQEIKEQIDLRILASELQEMVRTDLTDEGLELSLNSGIVFASGRANIEPQMEETLNSMLQVLAPYSGRYHFAVEGHTDDQPVAENSPFVSNWDLSAARAITVRGRLEELGVDRDRIRVEGYADTISLPEEKLQGLNPDERRARHRRVVVRVY